MSGDDNVAAACGTLATLKEGDVWKAVYATLWGTALNSLVSLHEQRPELLSASMSDDNHLIICVKQRELVLHCSTEGINLRSMERRMKDFGWFVAHSLHEKDQECKVWKNKMMK